MARLLVTADLHYNHARSKPLADELIDRINAMEADILLVVGDTAVGDGDALEQCLQRFRFKGPKLLVAGNHELWSAGGDSHAFLFDDLPRRAQAIGWQCLQSQPFIGDDLALVGSVGWYDYSFASDHLGIPHRFYERKISPGAAARFSELAYLFDPADDIAPHAREIVARWNDGKHVRLGRSDEQFLAELLARLRVQLDAVTNVKTVIAAVHHLPFRELLPPNHSAQWDFAKAYLGSEKIGQLLLQFPNITHVFCGHSHYPAAIPVQHLQAINIGSGYRHKTFWMGEVG